MVWLTDIHVGTSDYLTRLQNDVAFINTLDPAPAFIVVSGDLTWGSLHADMIACHDALEVLNVPWYATPGNHDRYVAGEYDDHIGARHFTATAGDVTIIGYESLESIDGEYYGRVSAAELTWLETQLQTAVAAGKTPICLTHYPLWDGRTPGRIIQSDEGGSEVLALYATYGVKAHLAGHIHSPMDAIFQNGFWNVTAPSTRDYPDHPNGGFVIGNIFDDLIQLDWRDGANPFGAVSGYNPVSIDL